MELVKPSVTLIEENNILKKIELAGRTCYKSEDKITEGSAEKFVKMLCNHRHTAMTEHGTVYLTFYWQRMPDEDMAIFENIMNSRFTEVIYEKDNYYSTTNFRVIFEQCGEDFDKTIHFIENYGVAPTEYHDKRYTFKIVCDRGVSHELVRHRVFSFAQESTRYVNYKKKGMQFITPAWWGKDTQEFVIADTEREYIIFYEACKDAERAYNQLLGLGQTPQQARAVLPNALKTEVVMTGTLSQWKEFLKLRTAPDAHPDIQIIANKIQEILRSK